MPIRHSEDVSAKQGWISRGGAEFDRGIGFYDAIYGFAITLLIANVDAPPAAAWSDLPSLLETGVLHQLGGFALSFIVIAAFWRVNVRLVRRLSGMGTGTTIANLVAAAFVILIPFTTQGISDPESTPYALPTAVYAVNIAFVSLSQLAVFEVGRIEGLEIEPLSAPAHRAFLIDAIGTPVVFLASVPIALLWDANLAKLFWASLIIIGPITARLVR